VIEKMTEVQKQETDLSALHRLLSSSMVNARAAGGRGGFEITLSLGPGLSKSRSR
jgi:hypothetical protein